MPAYAFVRADRCFRSAVSSVLSCLLHCVLFYLFFIYYIVHVAYLLLVCDQLLPQTGQLLDHVGEAPFGVDDGVAAARA